MDGRPNRRNILYVLKFIRRSCALPQKIFNFIAATKLLIKLSKRKMLGDAMSY